MQDIEGVVAESFNSPPTPEIDVLWVAYSGGLDSTCLLHMAVDHFGPELIGAIHINHGADADSDEWEQHCHRTAESLGVQFHSERIGPFDGNFEAKSRAARYSLWSQQLGDDDIIVTAHHANDVAETRLWQMLTGRAAIGIPVWRPLGRGWVWRPLLGVTRSQLQQWAEQRNLTWIRDQSNDDLRFDRNWIRHELLPSLDKRFPNVVTAIAGMQHTHFGRPRPAPLPINEIGRANTMEVLRSWLWAYRIVPSESAVREIARQATSRQDANPVVRVSSEATVQRHRQNLYVVRDLPPIKETTVVAGQKWTDCAGELTWSPAERGIPEHQSLQLRVRQSGDRVRIRGIHRPLKKLFQERSIPSWQRDHWPVLCSENRIVSVPGLALDDSFVTAGLSPVWQPSIELGGTVC